jgi:hypothetical protein
MSAGPLHTGQGHQYIFQSGPDVRNRRPPGRDRHAMARDDLIRLLRRFVPLPDTGRALAMVDENGTVLLTGARGSGRHATARMLLYRLSGPRSRLQELADRSAVPDEPVLDADAVEAGDLLLLDLSNTEDDRYRALLPRLSWYRAEISERGAHLAVVLPPDRERSLPGDLASLVVSIGRPDGLLVLRGHLRADQIPFQADQLGAPALLPYLTSGPIRDIAALATLVRTARDRAGSAGAFPDWLAVALKAMSDQDGDVATQLRDLPDGRQRALLLTSAMLSGAPADVVHHATARLLDTTGFPADDRPALARPSLSEQLSAIKVETDRAGRVRFAALGYDRAVRTHFWTNFPDLRKDFRNWIGEVSTLPAEDDRTALVVRFAEQALRHDRPNDLFVLAKRWADQRAEVALAAGLRDERYGWLFRRQIYDWSRDSGLSANLTEVVIRVCADVLALTHPDQALVRLQHLARRQGGPAARAALVELVQPDARLFRRLLDRIVADLSRPDPWSTDVDLFRAVAEPSLVRDVGLRERLVAGWHAVLGLRPEAARDWLPAGTDDRVLSVLVAACGDRAAACNRLYAVGRDWAREAGADHGARGRIVADLADRIDAAQGIEPTEARTEETTG